MTLSPGWRAVCRARHRMHAGYDILDQPLAKVGEHAAWSCAVVPGRCVTVAVMSERGPGYDRGDEGRTRVAARDAAICEAVSARYDADEDTAGWLAALWRALAPAYHRDGGQAEGCNLTAATYRA